MPLRLHHDQPTSFAFTPVKLAWAKAQMTDCRQARTIIGTLDVVFGEIDR
jgi:NADH:ubiquinone oxidoreductase subunit D